MAIDPGFAQRLARLIHEEHAGLQGFIGLLQREEALLIATQIDALATLAEEKTALYRALQRLSDERVVMFARLGAAVNDANIRVVLADLPDDAIEDAIRVNRQQLTGEHAPDKLWLLVEQTRRNGYAFDNGRLFAGGCGIGMSIAGCGGPAVGAVSVGAISARMPPERIEELVAALRGEIQSILKALAAREQLIGNSSVFYDNFQ